MSRTESWGKIISIPFHMTMTLDRNKAMFLSRLRHYLVTVWNVHVIPCPLEALSGFVSVGTILIIDVR